MASTSGGGRKKHSGGSGVGTSGTGGTGGSKHPGRLSGGSFKGRFISATSPHANWAKERFHSGDRSGTAASGGSSSSISSSSSSALSVPVTSPTAVGNSPGTSRSSLNRIASSASNFQTYASRYIESIRPKSWGKTNSSGNLLSAPVDPLAAGGSLSAGNSRAESPLGAIPQLLTFRTPNRLSPSIPSTGSSSPKSATSTSPPNATPHHQK